MLRSIFRPFKPAFLYTNCTHNRREERATLLQSCPSSGRRRQRANDFDGDTAERYGYVNRALPDAELDGFVDALARRIASFDRRAIAAARNLVNQVSLPSADLLLAAITSFETALTWPETQQRIQNLLQRGLQRDSDFEARWPEVLGTLLET